MDPQQLREAHRRLEDEVTQAVAEKVAAFQDATGLLVKDIRPMFLETSTLNHPRPYRTLSHVRVEVGL